jgi:hypothetical protein
MGARLPAPGGGSPNSQFCEIKTETLTFTSTSIPESNHFSRKLHTILKARQLRPSVLDRSNRSHQSTRKFECDGNLRNFCDDLTETCLTCEAAFLNSASTQIIEKNPILLRHDFCIGRTARPRNRKQNHRLRTHCVSVGPPRSCDVEYKDSGVRPLFASLLEIYHAAQCLASLHINPLANRHYQN